MTIDPILPAWLILFALVPLALLFIFLEWRRAARFRFARIMSALIMVCSLAAICLRPSHSTLGSDNVLLLTSGYRKATVDSLLKIDPSLTIKHASDAIPYEGSAEINSFRELDRGGDIDAVAGIGVPRYALDNLKDHFAYYPADHIEGITSIYLPDEIRKSYNHSVYGVYHDPKKTTTLYLESPAGKLDSVSLGKGSKPFHFSFTPRASGKVLYNVSARDSAGRLLTEKLPLYIEEPSPLKILILLGYPTFEIQYLKNFLAHQHHKLSVRFQLSKDIFRYEYANRGPIQINRLTKTGLQEYDILIADVASIAKLSSGETSILNQSVKDGLGLLLMVNTQPPGRIPADLLPFELRKVNHDTTNVSIGATAFNLPATALRPINNENLQSVIANKSGVVAGYAPSNRGKVGFQLLQETYRLFLRGDSLRYGMLWSPLIDRVSRRVRKPSTIQMDRTNRLYADEPFGVDVTSSASAPTLLSDSVQVPLQEDEFIDGLWHTTVWAGKEGWHLLHTSDGDSINYYVFESGAWNALRTAVQIKANRIKSHGALPQHAQSFIQQKKYPPVFFYILFVISAGFLWLAPKI